MTKSEKSCRHEKLMGSQTPSDRIVPYYAYTDGPDAVKVLAVGKLIVDPWQSEVLNDWMGRTEDDVWSAPTCGLSVPRQNGKTLDTSGRIASGMILYAEWVIYTAHADGRKIYPEIGFGQNLTNFSGMTAAVSDTVSAKNEITPDTKLLGIVGQFDAFRWGVQRSIGAHLIEYGDPDGLGDLQRQNQIAIRAEIVYGIGIMDQAAFTKIVKAEG